MGERDRDVHRAGPQQVERLGRLGLPQPDVEAGMALGQQPDRGGHQGRPGRGERRQPHGARPQVGERGQVVGGGPQPRRDGLGVAQQHRARLGQPHPARHADHQRQAGLAFEGAQVLADRRLGPAQRAGRAPDGARAGDLAEDEQAVGVGAGHAISIPWVRAKEVRAA
nr:hypothetical protein [Streptomonospora mangrovi]